MIRQIAVVVSLAAALATAAACSSSSSSSTSTPCNEDPSQCATGTTCWPIDTVPNFACIKSDPSVASGAACEATPNAATCADDSFCLQVTTAGGTCQPYCNISGASTCPAGESCQTAVVQGSGTSAPKVNVCAPKPGSGTDAGTETDSGSTADAGDAG